MNRLFILICFFLLFSAQSHAAILVFNQDGTYATKADLSAAVTAADAEGKTVVVTSPQTVSDNLVWPTYMTIEVRKGAIITIATGKALVFNGALSAGNYQIFSGFGAVSGLKESRPEWFGAKSDGTTDDTAALQKAFNSSQKVTLSKCTYKITDTLSVSGAIRIIGAGANFSEIKMYSRVAKPAIYINIPDGASFFSGELAQFKITGNGGSARCDGIKFYCVTPAAISHSSFHHLQIRNVRNGIDMEGVICMIDVNNILVNGVTGAGFITRGTQEIIYNKFSNLQVTEVESGAYAYYMSSAASQYSNITADGCCYFAGAYTHVQGLSIEGIYASTPASKIALQLNQIAELSNVAIINVPNSTLSHCKCV